MAFTDPNRILIARELVTDIPPNKRIDINGAQAPNGIAFYTGDPAELFPSVLQPQTEANDIGIQFASPQTAADNIGSILKLYTHKFSPDNSEALLTTPGFLGLATKRELQLTNVTSGDTLDMNTVGGTVFNGPHFVIVDPSLSGNQGVDVTGGYLRPNTLNTWQSVTALGIAFVNSWTDVAGARFGAYKDAVGNVHLRGNLISGTAVTILTLPVGWRPSSNLEFTMRAGTVVSAVSVSTAGVLAVTANFATAAASGIFVDCINYPTA